MRRVSPGRFVAALERWAEADGEDPARTRLGRIYSDYRATLERIGRSDDEQQAVAALDVLRRRPGSVGGSPVMFYGFDDLTPLQLDAIETLGRLVDAEVTVSLAYEPGRIAFAGRAGVFQELLPLAAEVRELPPRSDHYAPDAAAALGHIERHLFETDAARIEAGETVRLLEGGGERAELELIAREVAELIAAGMPAGEIAVLARAPLLGSELLREVFASAGVPIAMRLPGLFGDAPIGRGLIGLLRSVEPAGAAQPGRAADLLAWLRTPGMLEQPALADRLEAELMRGGIEGAAEARALWESRHWPLERIDRLLEAQERGPAALLDRVVAELGLLFAAPRRGLASVLGQEEMDDAQALAAGRGALGELRELAALAPELAPGRAIELAEALARDRASRPRAPGGFGGGGARPAGAARTARKGAVPLRAAGGCLPGSLAPAALALRGGAGAAGGTERPAARACRRHAGRRAPPALRGPLATGAAARAELARCRRRRRADLALAVRRGSVWTCSATG